MSEARALTTGLPSAPKRVAGEDGQPRFGLYSGSLDDTAFTDLKDLPGRLQRRLLEKKWQYVSVATADMMLALAIVDCGYLSTGMCAVFDRGARRLLIDANPVLPPLCAQIADRPGDGLTARLVGPGIRASLHREGACILLRAAWAPAEIELVLDAGRAPMPLTAIAKVASAGRFDVTQKTALVPAEGEVRVGNVRFPVRGQLAGLDYTRGLLARETSWRWAFASGRAGAHLVAFNFSEGFLLGEGENAAWIDGDPQPIGPVRFTFAAQAPLQPWKLESADGSVDLSFQPEGFRSQDIDLRLIRSRYVQPFGTFSGRLRGVTIEALPGVTEDHDARW
jgi:hypothetical protein